ncbi:transcriptional regulator, RpiR family [Ruminococcaceae bacterium YRB3002]|nr:transcriptional regulator, RpiR family [Ruminococcaceae bacterium YRB3002]
MGIIESIEQLYPAMSKSHKMIADYILSSYDKAAYMTASKIASAAGVSEATVVRFTNEIGYAGYPAFQQALKEDLKSRLTSVQRLDYTDKFADNRAVVQEVMKADEENLKYTLSNMSQESFDEAVDRILKARKIYIMGIRASAPLSEFMHFYMTILFDDVVLVRSNCINELFEQVMPITKDDVLIGISFPRYSTRTINSMAYAHQKGASTIAITDRDDTPMTKNADVALLATSSMASFVDSLTAPLSVINALLVALGMHRKEHIKHSFESLETLWSQYKVYETGRDRMNGESDEDGFPAP